MPTVKEIQRELCRREWAERIAKCESSNMSVRERCTANGVNVNTYYGRVAALKKDNLKQNKLPVQEIVPLSTGSACCFKCCHNRTFCCFITSQACLCKERVILRKEEIEIVLPPDISENMILSLLRGLKECWKNDCR